MDIVNEQDIKLFNCKVGDKVYVYKKKLLQENDFTINKDLIGTIIDFEQRPWSDVDDFEYLGYKATIEFKNGKTICIKDRYNKPFFKVYSFILLEDLKEALEKMNESCKTTLNILNNIISQ